MTKEVRLIVNRSGSFNLTLSVKTLFLVCKLFFFCISPLQKIDHVLLLIALLLPLIVLLVITTTIITTQEDLRLKNL